MSRMLLQFRDNNLHCTNSTTVIHFRAYVTFHENHENFRTQKSRAIMAVTTHPYVWEL